MSQMKHAIDPVKAGTDSRMMPDDLHSAHNPSYRVITALFSSMGFQEKLTIRHST